MRHSTRAEQSSTAQRLTQHRTARQPTVARAHGLRQDRASHSGRVQLSTRLYEISRLAHGTGGELGDSWGMDAEIGA
eukprot:2915079-Rhodomonas_salina.2